MEPIKYDYILRSNPCFLPSLHHRDALDNSGLFKSHIGFDYPHLPWGPHDCMSISNSIIDMCKAENKSKVLIVSDLFTEAIWVPNGRNNLKTLYSEYEYVIHFIKEPQYGQLGGKLSYCSITGQNFVEFHEEFLVNCKPDLVLYPSPVDVNNTIAKDSLLTTGFTDSFMKSDPPPITKESVNERKDFIYAGSEGGWPTTYKLTEGREQFLQDFKKEIANISSSISFDICGQDAATRYTKNYLDLTEQIRNYKYQIDPPNGYHFYIVRNFQSWFNNVIPLVFLSERLHDEFDRNYNHLPIKDGENCIIFNESNFKTKIKQACDPDLAYYLLDNISKMDLYDFSTEKMIKDLYDRVTA